MQKMIVLITLCGLLSIVGLVIGQEESAPAAAPQMSVLAEGLRNPAGLALLPDGTLLIAEEGTGNRDNSAGVSVRQPDGTLGRLVSGLPSSRDSGDLSGVALVNYAPDMSQIYIGNFAQGHLWTLPLPADAPLTVPDTPFMPDDLGRTMLAFNRVTLTNPFDMTFDEAGVPVVADASQNGVAKALANGRTRFIHRFDELEHPDNPNLTIDSVPTGIERIADEYYVTLTSGCPYPLGGGELVAIDESRNQRIVVDGLNMPIDVEQADDGTIWVLEFARFAPDGDCFGGDGYLPNSGRLSRLLPDNTLEPVVENLNFPVSAVTLPDGSLYISEIFDGEILHITFGTEAASHERFTLPVLDLATPRYTTIDDRDAALQQVIAEQDLTPYVGQELREDDAALVSLGRDLFFDPILSGDRNISCATCHHPALAMGDGRVLPIGTGGIGLGTERDFMTHIVLGEEYIGDEAGQEVPNPSIGQFVPRNSPTLINSALFPVQFWDGRVQSYALGAEVTTLENTVNDLQLSDALAIQALFPVISRAEMSGATFGEDAPQQIRRALAQRLTDIPAYQQRFSAIFGDTDVTPVQIVTALAAFERQLIMTESAWDDYIAGERDALTEQQKRGALLFYGELNPDVNCSVCHNGDLLTDFEFHNLLVPQLGPGKGNGINGREDWGQANVTFDWRNRYQFRTPSLRNVELTAPYFHTGAYATLEDVIWHHADIWQGASTYDPSLYLPQAFYSSLRPFDLQAQSATVAPQLANGLPLSEQDVADLVAFLNSLTDPNARDLMHLLPERVPSGLPLDPLPTLADVAHVPQRTERTSNRQVETADNTRMGDEWHFRDVTDQVGLDFAHGAFQVDLYDDPIAMMGAGLCWLDYDKDGWLDLYLVNSHAEDEYDALAERDALPHNQLYRNINGQFTPVDANTQLVLRGNGCVAADFDDDGWMDIYVTADGANKLLRNQGDGTFAEQARASGIASVEWNSNANVADVNGDGLYDLFIGGYIDLDNKIPNPFGAFPQDYYGIPDRLFINLGVDADGIVQFREVTTEVGLVREERTLGAIFSDVDRDGDIDLYVANDGQPNRLYENQALADDPLGIGFRFLDLTDTAEVGDAGSGMGVTSADYDGDGLFDLFVTNWEAELNALYRNETHEEGFINFRYSTYRIGMRGLGNNMTGWGTTWADFDHDTDIDLMTVNGRVPVTNFETDPELVRLYGNRLVERERPEYFEWTERVRLDDIGTLLARGSAVADYDNDGDLDVAINVIGGAAILLANEAVTGNWLQVELSRFAPGTIIEVTLPDGRVLVRELHAGSSYLASEDTRFHVGLGHHTQISRLVVFDGKQALATLDDVQANQLLVIDIGDPALAD